MAELLQNPLEVVTDENKVPENALEELSDDKGDEKHE